MAITVLNRKSWTWTSDSRRGSSCNITQHIVLGVPLVVMAPVDPMTFVALCLLASVKLGTTSGLRPFAIERGLNNVRRFQYMNP